MVFFKKLHYSHLWSPFLIIGYCVYISYSYVCIRNPQQMLHFCATHVEIWRLSISIKTLSFTAVCTARTNKIEFLFSDVVCCSFLDLGQWGHTAILSDWTLEKWALGFCLPVFLGIHRNPKQKDLFISCEGFLR